MKKTKCLFDEEKQTPAGMVSVSQLQSFMSCSKKWEYGYVENLTPRVERPYLSIGKLCHKGMQVVMQCAWKNQRTETPMSKTEVLRSALYAIDCDWEKYMEENTFLDEEIPVQEKMLEDAKSVFEQAFHEFDTDKYEVVTVYKDGRPFPALELHFVVPCAGSKGLHGYIDAILKDKNTGFTWCTDYKFRKALSPDEEEAYNIQNAVYCWACHKMGIDITGTMTWQHTNTPATDPQVLKNGAMSRAKIKTTWEHYAECCVRAGLDPADYEEEMKEKLADNEFYRPTYEYRNLETVKRIWNDAVVPASYAVKAAYKKNNRRSMYPWNCKMCQYQSICQAELRGYDAQAIRDREYVVRQHRQLTEEDTADVVSKI